MRSIEHIISKELNLEWMEEEEAIVAHFLFV